MKRLSPAFTLIELMVSIALVLILMYGVSRVFTTTQAVVSTNQAISNHTRDARAAQSVLARDFGLIVTDGAPFMFIRSSVQDGFRNKADMDGDRDGNPRTIDLDGNNVEGDNAVFGEDVPNARYNDRNHRVDRLSFFERGLFRRQTGGTVATAGQSPFLAQMTATEAWVWYGHLRIPNNSGSVTNQQDPGAGSLGVNQNNFFATDWILGREQFLLKEKSAANSIVDNANQPQIFIDGMNTIPAGVARPDLQPLQYQSGANSGTYQNNTSRWDLAATSISEFRNRLNTWIIRDANAGTLATQFQWYSEIFGTTGRRFQTDPFIRKPITAANVAFQSPIFMRGCTQFIVEYAGDYVSQVADPALATWGNVDGIINNPTVGQPTTDGILDYVVVGVGANRRKEVRWYGMPRDTNGDGAIPGFAAGRTNNQMPDVVPLRDVMLTYNATVTTGAPHEKDMANAMRLPTGTGPTGVPSDYMASTGGMLANAEYICAWGPNDKKPAMIRITLVLDDPLGRIQAEGQIFEYVFTLP